MGVVDMAVVTEQGPAPAAADRDLLDRAADLEDVIRRGGDEAQQLRRCPSFVIDALVEAGFFRFTMRHPPLGRPPVVRRTRQDLPRTRNARRVRRHRRPGTERRALGTQPTATDVARPGLSEEQLGALVGHRFTGGHARIEHWENWLLTDCTGPSPMPDGESVTARGRVTSVANDDGGERRATCEVWLKRNGEHVVTDTAVAAIGSTRR